MQVCQCPAWLFPVGTVAGERRAILLLSLGGLGALLGANQLAEVEPGSSAARHGGTGNRFRHSAARPLSWRRLNACGITYGLPPLKIAKFRHNVLWMC
jgi:hypothetical protein